MRIWHSESSLGWGGQENRTLTEMIALRGRGHEMALIAPPGSRLGEEARTRDFPVFEALMPKGPALRAVLALRRLLREGRPDILNTHSGRDSLLVGLAARSLLQRPIIVRTRHLILPLTHRATYTWLPDHVVTVSQAVRHDLIQRGIPADRVSAIPTCVDLARFDPAATHSRLREELGVGATTPLIGTVAILRGKKGHRDLLAAVPYVLRHVPDALFLIVGNGPQYEKLVSEAVATGLSANVRFLGLRRDVPEILATLDLFVLPTHQEALGTAFLEAQAMGVPVIGTRVGGVPETIREDITGLTVPPHDPVALAEAIIALLSDPERRKRLAAAARAWVMENFSVERMAEGMESLYQQLLHARS